MPPEPFWFQPDPKQPYFVQPKAERLIRRGPCNYLIVWKRPDGKQIETRLSSATFKMDGI